MKQSKVDGNVIDGENVTKDQRHSGDSIVNHSDSGVNGESHGEDNCGGASTHSGGDHVSVYTN